MPYTHWYDLLIISVAKLQKKDEISKKTAD